MPKKLWTIITGTLTEIDFHLGIDNVTSIKLTKGKTQMIKLSQIKLILLIIFLFWITTNASAQEGQTSSFSNRGSQYFLGDKDEILMNVNVWGYVLRPGQYLVPRHTDLITLISFAGGPKEGANLSDVKIISEGATASTNGHGQNGRKKKVPIQTVNVNDHIEKGKAGILPILKAGDTVLLTESGSHKFQKFIGFNSFFSVIAATASVALIIDRISK